MQQGFGIILLAEEVMRERRAREGADALRARHARDARDVTRRARGHSPRPHRLAICVPWFVVALTFTPTGGRAEAE